MTPSRPTRVLSILLSAALAHAALAPEALAQFRAAARVPARTSAPAIPRLAAGAATLPLSRNIGGLRLSPGVNALARPSLAAVPAAARSAQAVSAASPAAARAAASRAVSAAAIPVAPLAASSDKSKPAAASPAERERSATASGPDAAPAVERAAAQVANAKGIAARLDELRAAFGRRRAQSVEDGEPATASEGVAGVDSARAPPASTLAPASAPETQTGSGGPPAPPSGPQGPEDGKGSKKGGFFALGATAVAFILAMLVAQIGQEAMGNAMPVLAQRVFGDFTVVAQLTIFSSIASVIGRQTAPWAIGRFGLRNTFLAAEALRAISITGLILLLSSGQMTIPLMILFYSFNGFMGGAATTAEYTIPRALLGKDGAKIEQFKTWKQFLLEIIGVLGPIVAGFSVDAYGAGATLMAFPIAFGVAIAILFFTLRFRTALNAPEQAFAPQGGNGGFKAFFKKMAHGFRVVWHDKLLRYTFLAYTGFVLLNPLLYGMIGPAFGRLAGGVDGMGGVFGMVAGLYSAGGLFGAAWMIRAQSKLAKRKAAGELDDAREAELLRQSMLRSMRITIPTLAAFAFMAMGLPTLGAVASLPAWLAWAAPITLPAVLLMPFGAYQVMSVVKIESYFTAKIPNEKDAADAMGFLGSASLVIMLAGIMGLRYLFQLEGTLPFLILAGAMIPLGVFYYFITRALGRAGAPARP